jgi:hypothetical protein
MTDARMVAAIERLTLAVNRNTAVLERLAGAELQVSPDPFLAAVHRRMPSAFTVAELVAIIARDRDLRDEITAARVALNADALGRRLGKLARRPSGSLVVRKVAEEAAGVVWLIAPKNLA